MEGLLGLRLFSPFFYFPLIFLLRVFFRGFNMDMARPFLLHVLHGSHGRRYGVIVATGPGQIGWSKCAIRKGDKFDLNYGIQYALTRAANPEIDSSKIPEDFIQPIEHMKTDSLRHFGKKE